MSLKHMPQVIGYVGHHGDLNRKPSDGEAQPLYADNVPRLLRTLIGCEGVLRACYEKYGDSAAKAQELEVLNALQPHRDYEQRMGNPHIYNSIDFQDSTRPEVAAAMVLAGRALGGECFYVEERLRNAMTSVLCLNRFPGLVFNADSGYLSFDQLYYERYAT